MADFIAGDRVVKMSGVAAGRFGTVNGVRDDGTLNVTFDGERRPRFCDPERCGKVSANATFKKGDRVKLKGSSKLGTVVGGMGSYMGAGSLGSGSDYPEDVSVRWDSYKFDVPVKPENLVFANSRACNAKFKVGDRITLVADAGAWHKGEKGTIRGGDYLPGYVLVKFDGGTEGRIPKEKLVAANSRSCNAKFRVGQKVQYTGRTGKIVTAVVKGELGTPGYYLVEAKDGTRIPMPEKLLKVANSRAANAQSEDLTKVAKQVNADAQKYERECREMARAIRAIPAGPGGETKSRLLLPKIRELYRESARDDITKPLTAFHDHQADEIRLSIERGIGAARRELWGALKDSGLLSAAQ